MYSCYSFKNEYSFHERYRESKRVLAKYPDRIPIICERSLKSRDCPLIDKKKYLVPKDLTIGQFLFVIRNRLKLQPEIALFIFVNNTVPPTSALIGQIYHKHKDVDDFLYISYSQENIFG